MKLTKIKQVIAVVLSIAMIMTCSFPGFAEIEPEAVNEPEKTESVQVDKETNLEATQENPDNEQLEEENAAEENLEKEEAVNEAPKEEILNQDDGQGDTYGLYVDDKTGSVEMPIDRRFTVDLHGPNWDDVSQIVWSIPNRNTASFVKDNGELNEAASVTYTKGETAIRNNIDLQGLAEGIVVLTAEIIVGGKTESAKLTIRFSQNGGSQGEDSWRVGFFDGDDRFDSISLKTGETRELRIEFNPEVVTNEIKSYSVYVREHEGEAPVFVVDGEEQSSIEKAPWKEIDNWITIKSYSDGYAGIEVILYGTDVEGDEGRALLEINRGGEGPEGDEGYDGPWGIHKADEDGRLCYWLEGWDNAWNTANGGDPVNITFKNGVYEVLIDVKDDLWNRVYNNVTHAKGINLRLYMESPDESVVAYSRDFRGSDESYDDLAKTLLALRPQINTSKKDSEKNSAVDVSIFTIMPSDNRTILAPMGGVVDHLGYAWFTDVSPKAPYNFGDNENVENVEIADFKIEFADRHNITVQNESELDSEWITFDASGVYGNAGVLRETEYKLGNISYVLDTDTLMNGDGTVVNKEDLVTEITVPGATNIQVREIKKANFGYNIVGNTVTFTTSAWKYDYDYQAEYEITYNVGGDTYRKLFMISVNTRRSHTIYDAAGFVPVPKERIHVQNDMLNGSRGFYIKVADRGNLATKWSGKNVNMRDVCREIEIEVPDREGLIGYKTWGAQGNIGLYQGNVRDALEIKEQRLPSMNLNANNGEGQFEFETFFLPEEFDVGGKKAYAIHTRAPGENEVGICFIEWIYDEKDENQNIFEYYFWIIGTDDNETESDANLNEDQLEYTVPTMPAYVHETTQLPTPRLYAVYDKNGQKLTDTGYSLKVEFFGIADDGSDEDYDYYRITLVDENGFEADLQQGWVEIIFTYPNGKTMTEMKNMNFVLSHYQDETHQSSAKEKLSFEEDGIHVKLDHCSPFLLTWSDIEEDQQEEQDTPINPHKSVKSGTSQTKTFTGTWNNPVATGNWTMDANGVWHYNTTAKFANTWGYIVNPYAQAGQPAASWFWFDAMGNMLTGWQFINGKWYYLNSSKDGMLGACQLGGVTPDGWTVDENGAWIESIPKK